MSLDCSLCRGRNPQRIRSVITVFEYIYKRHKKRCKRGMKLLYCIFLLFYNFHFILFLLQFHTFSLQLAVLLMPELPSFSSSFYTNSLLSLCLYKCQRQCHPKQTVYLKFKAYGNGSSFALFFLLFSITFCVATCKI